MNIYLETNFKIIYPKLQLKKQKSRSIFIGLHQKKMSILNTSNQPFHRNPQWNVLHKNWQSKQNLSDSVSSVNTGNSLFSKIFPHTSSDEKLVTQENLHKYPPEGCLQFFCRNWDKLINGITF